MPNPAFAGAGSYADNVSTTLAITNSSIAMSAGDVVVCVVATYCDTVVPGPGTMADNQGNSFTLLLSKSNTTTDRVRLDLFVSPPLASGVAIGSYTVTATANGSNGANTEQGFNIQRWTGFGALGAALDVSGTAVLASATASGTVTLSAGTAAQAVEAIIAAVHFNDSANPDGLTTPTGTGTWVADYSNTNATIGLATSVAHQVTSATGTAYSATWSGMDTSSNNGGVFLIAALTPAVSTTAINGAGANANTGSANLQPALTGSGSAHGSGAMRLSFQQGHSGSAILDFGTGSNEASAPVDLLPAIAVGANVEVFFMADDTTNDHTAVDHRYAARLIALSASAAVAGSGFNVLGRSIWKIQGTFKVRWVWV